MSDLMHTCIRTHKWFSFTVRLIVCTASLLSISCGSSGPKLHAARGKVLYDGQPAAGATVVLQSADGSSARGNPTGQVKPDGTFVLSTHPHGAGALEGEYVVLVTWFPADARQSANPTNKLPARYGDPKKTPLPKITIKAGGNDLEPFVLTSK